MTTLLCIACRVCALVLWKMQKELPMHLLLCSHVSPPKVPPLWGGQSWQQVLRPAPSQMRVLPLRLATGPPCGGANHGAWCYGECRGKCECFPSHPFFWCLIPPKTGGSVATQRPPPPLGGAQLRGGWPPLWGGQLPFPLATGPPIVWGGHGAWCYGERRGKCECFPSHPFFGASSPPKRGGVLPHKGPPTFGGGPVAWRVAPPCGGANFPSLLPLAPP